MTKEQKHINDLRTSFVNIKQGDEEVDTQKLIDKYTVIAKRNNYTALMDDVNTIQAVNTSYLEGKKS